MPASNRTGNRSKAANKFFLAKIFNIPVNAEATDEALLEEFKLGGQQDILAILYLRYSDLLYGVCLKYLTDPEDAKDAVMNIYQDLVRKLPHQEITHFKSWLYVVAKNFCLQQLRAAKKNRTISLETQSMQSGEFSHLDHVMEKEEEFKRLEKCMDTLTDEQKRSIQLFYYEDKCYNEIVAETGMDWNKVRSAIQNARRNLKICMEKNAG